MVVGHINGRRKHPQANGGELFHGTGAANSNWNWCVLLNLSGFLPPKRTPFAISVQIFHQLHHNVTYHNVTFHNVINSDVMLHNVTFAKFWCN